MQHSVGLFFPPDLLALLNVAEYVCHQINKSCHCVPRVTSYRLRGPEPKSCQRNVLISFIHVELLCKIYLYIS